MLKIIMNAPYSGNLHLKILSHLISLYPDAEVVNLSPIKWHNPRALIDDNNSANKIVLDFSNIFSHLKDLEVIDSEKAKAMFGTCDSNDLGIYHITSEGGHSVEEYIHEPLAIKLLKREGTKWLSEVTTVLPQSNEFIRMPTIYGNEDKKWLKKVCSPDFDRYYNLDKGQKHCRPYVNFSTKDECANFHKSLSEKCNAFLMSVILDFPSHLLFSKKSSTLSLYTAFAFMRSLMKVFVRYLLVNLTSWAKRTTSR